MLERFDWKSISVFLMFIDWFLSTKSDFTILLRLGFLMFMIELVRFKLKLSEKVWWGEFSRLAPTNWTGCECSQPSRFSSILQNSWSVYHRSNGATIKNSFFCARTQQDQLLLSWLQSTISGSVMTRTLGCAHASHLWTRIHDHFQKKLTHTCARQLRAEMRVPLCYLTVVLKLICYN